MTAVWSSVFLLVVLCALLLAPGTAADPVEDDDHSPLSRSLEDDWRQFKLRYGKRYASASEEKRRRLAWQSNNLRVLRHNRLASVGLRSFTIAVNRFADLTRSKFAAAVKLARVVPRRQRSPEEPGAAARLPLFAIGLARQIGDPDPGVDWRLKGCVSPVRNQGELSSAAVYSVVGSIEGQLCARYGPQPAWLSNQQVIDCAQATSSPEGVYAYLASNQGRLDVGASCYPDTGSKGPCAFKPNCTGAIVQGVADVPSGSEAALQSALGARGPVTVAVDASQMSFQLYQSGVYNEPNCSSQSVDHVMLAVGYGVAATGEPYWLVKNSWGTEWGEDGYIRMSRDRDNQCGIATDASYAIVKPVT